MEYGYALACDMIMININMRCIEMYPKLLGDAVTARLTLT